MKNLVANRVAFDVGLTTFKFVGDRQSGAGDLGVGGTGIFGTGTKVDRPGVGTDTGGFDGAISALLETFTQICKFIGSGSDSG